MELTGEQIVRAPRQQVWDALNDPLILSRCIPGCEEVTKVSDTETHTRVSLKLGPVRARFAGKMFMTDIVTASSCTLTFEGAGGAAGFANGRSAVTLTDQGSGTKLAYSVQANVGGKLGQIGGRLIDSSAKKMADEFFAAFDAVLTGGSIPEVATAAATSPISYPGPAATGQHGAQPPFSGGFTPELYRAFWFGLGVACTLFISHWVR
jgi:carbon monoxide dehydrogenase subunit G